MSTPMHVLVVQFAPTWEDKPASRARIEAMLDDAAPPPGTLVVLPELGETGFTMNVESALSGDSIGWARSLAVARDVHVLLGHGVPCPDDAAADANADPVARPPTACNGATLVARDGSVAPTYRKVFPMSILGESKRYRPGDRLVVAHVEDALVAPLICYDLRFPELWRLAREAGAEVIVNIASWPSPRAAHWRALLIARAIENQAFVIGCNRTGSDPNLAYRGGSIIVAPDGTVVAELDDEEAILRATIDIEDARALRTSFPVARDVRRDLLGSITVVGDREPPEPA